MAKCKVLHAGRTNRMKEYTMEGKILEKVQEEKHLGVMVHKAMNGSRQVTEAVKKANRALAQLRRTTSNKEIDTVIPIYKATVRPHLEYCIQAWAPYLKKDINALEQVRPGVNPPSTIPIPVNFILAMFPNPIPIAVIFPQRF